MTGEPVGRHAQWTVIGILRQSVFFGEYIAEMIADANFFGAKIKGLFGFPEGPLPITSVLYKIFAGVALLYA